MFFNVLLSMCMVFNVCYAEDAESVNQRLLKDKSTCAVKSSSENAEMSCSSWLNNKVRTYDIYEGTCIKLLPASILTGTMAAGGGVLGGVLGRVFSRKNELAECMVAGALTGAAVAFAAIYSVGESLKPVTIKAIEGVRTQVRGDVYSLEEKLKAKKEYIRKLTENFEKLKNNPHYVSELQGTKEENLKREKIAREKYQGEFVPMVELLKQSLIVHGFVRGFDVLSEVESDAPESMMGLGGKFAEKTASLMFLHFTMGQFEKNGSNAYYEREKVLDAVRTVFKDENIVLSVEKILNSCKDRPRYSAYIGPIEIEEKKQRCHLALDKCKAKEIQARLDRIFKVYPKHVIEEHKGRVWSFENKKDEEVIKKFATYMKS